MYTNLNRTRFYTETIKDLRRKPVIGRIIIIIKTPKTAQKTSFSYLKTDSSYELPLTLVLIRMATFYCNVLTLNSQEDQKTPKNSETRQKTPIPHLKNGLSYELILPLILIRRANFYIIFQF